MIDVDILDNTYQYIITTFVLNKMLHHVGMLWIIETREQLQHDLDKKKSEWMTGGPWYNTSICGKLHGKFFEGFIRHARTDRYNIMCSIDAHEKQHQSYSDDGSINGGCTLPTNSATESLDSLGATINFINLLDKGLRT